MAVTSVTELIARYSGNLPRYTSYPTAVSFTEAVGPDQAEVWLKQLPEAAPLSFYFHVPFCDELCRFCGCNTSVMRQESGRAAYGNLLTEEFSRIIALVGTQHSVRHIQFGGGTPSTLPPATLRLIMSDILASCRVEDGAELSMELDPRHVPQGYPALLGELGFTRISIGVQDLNEKVQQACGRIQSFEQTEACVSAVRQAGVQGVNIDLIYGLPFQTQEGVAETVRRIVTLRPDRLAVFGYAHVPWKQKRQTLIAEESLPGAQERLAQRAVMDEVLCEAGYVPVGLDHYALPEDALVKSAQSGTLRRNFQGYTVDSAEALIGVGASAISMLPDGYVQNITSAAAYARALSENATALPVVRGVERTSDDRLRGYLIERLMCDMQVDLATSGLNPEYFSVEVAALAPMVKDGLVLCEGSMIQVTGKGRPFLRNIAAVFDARRQNLPSAGAVQASSPRFSYAI